MEHEHRDLVEPCWAWRAQRADEAVDLTGLEVLAHDGGQRLDGRRGS